MDHLAIPVRDQKRSRRFYEIYFGLADGVKLVSTPVDGARRLHAAPCRP